MKVYFNAVDRTESSFWTTMDSLPLPGEDVAVKGVWFRVSRRVWMPDEDAGESEVTIDIEMA